MFILVQTWLLMYMHFWCKNVKKKKIKNKKKTQRNLTHIQFRFLPNTEYSSVQHTIQKNVEWMFCIMLKEINNHMHAHIKVLVLYVVILYVGGLPHI